MIAFDLDGVFIPDFEITEENKEQILNIRNKTKPLFIPKGEYYIITGRPIEDEHDTLKWIEREFSDNPPIEIFIGAKTFNDGIKFKEQILNQHKEITEYYESDQNQCDYLNEKCKHDIIVYHFSSFIRGYL